MDARMLDLPLNVVFYKWLLGLESTFGPADLHHVDPALALHLGQFFYASVPQSVQCCFSENRGFRRQRLKQ